MKNLLKNILLVTAGATIGAVGAWFVAKKKYEKITNEEIASVKEVFAKKKNHLAEKENNSLRALAEETGEIETETRSESDDDMEEKEYVYTVQPQTDMAYEEKPYVIPPDEFGEEEEYKKVTLLFFRDHVLTYEDYTLVEEVDKIIGEGSLRRFGEYEDDSVFVRNEKRKCDYEILMDNRRYQDIVRDQMKGENNE